MAFKVKKLICDGTAQVAIASTTITESVVHTCIFYNSGITDATVDVAIDGTVLLQYSVPSNGSLRTVDKINVPVNTTLTVTAANGVTVSLMYIEQAIDITAGLTAIQSEVQIVKDAKPNIDVVASNMPSIDTVVNNITDIQNAEQNALIAQSAANYKGAWIVNYNAGSGYSIGDSVVYIDDKIYVSNINGNTVEPTAGLSTVEWYMLNIGIDMSLIDCGGASNNSAAIIDAGSASSMYV